MKNVNQIVATGSVDGILTTAALLRAIGNEEVGVEFAQAFTVDKIDPSTWQPNSQVAFVDLAVNNRDKSMTEDFVRRIKEAGHEIVAVCDEHCREDWLEVLGSFDGLTIEPENQAEGTYRSSGALLKASLGDHLDEHGTKLCDDADAGDRMDFTTHFGAIANQAVKSRIHDDSRRVYLARHLASHSEPDPTIQGWIKEYEQILANHDEIVDNGQDLNEGFVRVNTTGKVVDMTTLMRRLYDGGAKIVVCEGEMYNKSLGCKTKQIAFGTNDRDLDLLNALQQANVPASGFAQKANVEPEHEAQAIEVLRNHING